MNAIKKIIRIVVITGNPKVNCELGTVGFALALAF